jgi:glycosyltransferase involved in cell wall biosynthesis
VRPATGGSLRLLVVTPRALPDVGGVEKHVWETTRRFAAAGVDVTILTTGRTVRGREELRVEDVRIVRVQARPRTRDYYFAPGIPREIARLQADVVHCQSYHTLVPPLAMTAAWRAGIPYLLSFHSGGHTSELRTQLRGLQFLALRPLVKQAARLICVSRFERDLLASRLRLPPARFDVVRNGGDLPDPGPITPGPYRTIASIGRLERYKGHHRIIGALPHLLRTDAEVRLELVGDGSYRGELLALAERLGVAHAVSVRLVPAEDGVAMARLMRAAAAVVLLSDYESQGLAAVEAAGVGTPVLVQRSSALRELVAAGLADAVEPDASDVEIAAAVEHLLDRPAPTATPAIPTWDDCADQLLSMYVATASRGGP